MKKAFFTACLLLLLGGTPASAGLDGLAHYELALGGYQLGMSYEDAVMVRPFVSLETYRWPHSGIEVTKGAVDQVYLADIAFSFQIIFVDERVEQILGRFSPLATEQVRALLVETFGAGQNKDRVLLHQAGFEEQLIHHHWVFPEARVDLVCPPSTVGYATLALQVQNSATRERKADLREKNDGDSTADPAVPSGSE